jgi:predicted ribosome-associated RNA-binding protein Tma20
VCSFAVTVIAVLTQDPLFEKVFVDAIKCVLSAADIEKTGATETELLAACASRNTVIVRNALGILM